MQTENERISNRNRTEATRAVLITAARRLFIEKGYAETGTPEIVAIAGVTRGALYHHFADKAELFFAVTMEAANEISAEIARKSKRQKSPLNSLIAGAEAYFAAMSEAGRARLILLDAPSILSGSQMQELSSAAGEEELRAGLENILPASKLPIAALTDLLSAAFDRAALAIARGEDSKPYRSAIKFIVESLAEGGQRST